MRAKRYIYRSLNRALSHVNLTVKPIAPLLNNRVITPHILDIIFKDIASIVDKWLTSQKIFETQVHVGDECIKYFYNEYLSSPFREQFGGSGFNNLLWLFAISRAAKPSIAIDSGTYKGASAWALRIGSPTTQILSFDIDLSQLVKRIEGVEYVQSDWTVYDFSRFDLSDAIAYFDDHTDQAARLIQTNQKGIPVAIFDDDYSVHYFAEQAHGGAALPKIEFVTDPALREVDTLEWVEGTTKYSWEVNRAYLDRALSVIDLAERLPATPLISGIQQLPYKIVRLSNSDKRQPTVGGPGRQDGATLAG